MNALFGNLSPITKKVRIAYLKSIGITDTNYDVLTNLKAIKSKIESSNNPKTRKTRVFHIIEYLKAIGDVSLLKSYTDMMIKYKEKSDEAETNNSIANDKKADRYVKLKELQNLLDEFKPEINLSNPSYKMLKDFQKYLILGFYVFNPPIRNDLAKLKIITNQKNIKKEGNFIVINNRNVYIYLNEYKNARSMGRTRVELDVKNIKAVRDIMKLYKALNLIPEYLINSISEDRIEPASEATTLQMIIRYTKEVFGKQMSINDFRHIWEMEWQSSDWYKGLTVGERENLHKKLLHGTATAWLYNRV